MAFKDSGDFIKTLEKHSELFRIKHYVNPELEITEITDRFSKQLEGGKALLFENNGSKFPVLINSLGSINRLCLAFNIKNIDDIGERINSIFKTVSSPNKDFSDKLKMLPLLKNVASWMPKIIKGRGKCQEIIITEPDLSILPVLKCWKHDGGKFITLPLVITKDADTGMRNVGMYRMQVFDKNTTGMHWHLHKTGARHFETYKNKKIKMPVSVVLGGDPVHTFSAIAPLPDNIDEFLLSGFLRNKKVELVKCISNDLEVPADADIIIEGYIDTTEELALEGPFGDHTGFYSLPDYYPKFHVTCITHRKNAVYPATIVGIPPMEDAWISKLIERIFLIPIKLSLLPELSDMDLPIIGVSHNLTIVKIKNSYPGHAIKVAHTLWGAGQMMFNKILVVVDESQNIHDYKTLIKHICNSVDINKDIFFSKGPLDVLDHASDEMAFGGKMLIDATNTSENNKCSENLSIPNLCNSNPEIIKIIAGEYPGFFVQIKKNLNINVKSFVENNKNIFQNKDIKFICFTDVDISVFSDSQKLWYILNNIDPVRDIFTIGNYNSSILIVDATTKLLESDNFSRDWPNMVLSDKETIIKINSIWNNLDIGELIPSPSQNFITLSTYDSAYANK